MTSAHALRQMYLDFFVQQHGHALVASSPIVPPDDPTMLFTSAGMVQFKPLYAGQVDPLPYSRAASCQKCLRAGGKASDLENVGKTSRHHTFFEMLGNFSFGDYFKREALIWGWDFIWNHMKLPKERLWATIFEEDDEAEELLEKEVGMPSSRIIRLDAKENFWGPAGETGACGPCSEIIFFMGAKAELEATLKQDKQAIARRIVEEGDLFLEIWNMVFPQFNQQPDGSRPPLKNRGIDTGAGLERMTTALNFIETNGAVQMPYQTDLLKPIVAAAAELVGMSADPALAPEAERDEQERFWINALADHARALTFALSEGIAPSNEGRGYVLRRILRRAARFGYLLGKEEPFLNRLVEPVVNVMGEAYPEIKSRVGHVEEVIRLEEERFLRTLAQGTTILDKKMEEVKDAGKKVFAGEYAFLLHATYGFPVDMTEEILADEGIALDREGYGEAMKQHREEARQSWKGGAKDANLAKTFEAIAEENGETAFHGYQTTECQANIIALTGGTQRLESATVEPEGEILVMLDQTPFYAESGGQVGDCGSLVLEKGELTVTDTQKTPNGLFLHYCRNTSEKKIQVKAGSSLKAEIDAERRLATMRNHTVTHILQAALKSVLGEHITQSGSYVGPEGMRFDFSHTQAMTPEEQEQVEALVNRHILFAHHVYTEEMPLEDARARGAVAPFGEKYGHHVRVVQIGEDDSRVSLELCGGTHLDRVDRIGSFRLVAESSVAAGIRRIEGVTGWGAYETWARTRDAAQNLSRLLAVKETELVDRVATMQAEIKQLKKDVKNAGKARPSITGKDLLAKALQQGDIQIIAEKLDAVEPDTMRELADQVRSAESRVVCVLGTTDGKKVQLLCAVSEDLTKEVQAGRVIKEVAGIVGGGGGGRPDMAQAGGKNPEKLDEAIQKAPEIIASQRPASA